MFFIATLSRLHIKGEEIHVIPLNVLQHFNTVHNCHIY